MKELTTLRKYFEFRQSKGANVAHALEAIDTVEALLFAQELQAIRADKYRQASQRLIAAILTNYLTSGHSLGVNAILNTDADAILLEYLVLQYPVEDILTSTTKSELFEAIDERNKKIAELNHGLKVIIDEALDSLVA